MNTEKKDTIDTGDTVYEGEQSQSTGKKRQSRFSIKGKLLLFGAALVIVVLILLSLAQGK